MHQPNAAISCDITLQNHLGSVDLVSHQEALGSLSIQLPLKARGCEINASLKLFLKAHIWAFAVQIDVSEVQLIFNNIRRLNISRPSRKTRIKFQVRS